MLCFGFDATFDDRRPSQATSVAPRWRGVKSIRRRARLGPAGVTSRMEGYRQMIVVARPLACAALWIAALGALAGCGKPEDDGASPNTVTTPLPPYPAWSAGMIGKPLAAVAKGKANCFGVFDAIAAKHVGAKPGVEVDGWAWDKAAKQPVRHVLIVDLNDRIVGAADVVTARPDVVAAYPYITSKIVGWHGVAGTITGTVLAVGLGATGGQCSLSKSMRLDGGVY
jgi:hypothetical protein